MISKEEMESIGFKKEGKSYTMFPNDGLVTVGSSPSQLKIVVRPVIKNEYMIFHLTYINEIEYPVVVFSGNIENIDRMKSILNHTTVPKGSLYDK